MCLHVTSSVKNPQSIALSIHLYLSSAPLLPSHLKIANLIESTSPGGNLHEIRSNPWPIGLNLFLPLLVNPTTFTNLLSQSPALLFYNFCSSLKSDIVSHFLIRHRKKYRQSKENFFQLIPTSPRHYDLVPLILLILLLLWMNYLYFDQRQNFSCVLQIPSLPFAHGCCFRKFTVSVPVPGHSVFLFVRTIHKDHAQQHDKWH